MSTVVGVDTITDFNSSEGYKIVLDKATFSAFPLLLSKTLRVVSPQGYAIGNPHHQKGTRLKIWLMAVDSVAFRHTSGNFRKSANSLELN